MPPGSPRHAGRIVVRLVVAGRAPQPGDAESVGAAPHRRLMRAAIVALPGAIVGGVAVPAARMLEDLAGLGEERDRALARGRGWTRRPRARAGGAACALRPAEPARLPRPRARAPAHRSQPAAAGHEARWPDDSATSTMRSGRRFIRGSSAPAASRANGSRRTGRR